MYTVQGSWVSRWIAGSRPFLSKLSGLHFTWVDLFQAGIPFFIPCSLYCNCSGQTLAGLELLRMPILYIDVKIGELY